MSKIIAVYDSCVLYPAPLRDLLIRLAQTGLYRARLTDAIHEEWTRNLLEARPDLSRLRRSRRSSISASSQAPVDRAFEGEQWHGSSNPHKGGAD